MKLYQSLERIVKYRIESNAQIKRYMEEVSRIGKLDQPKQVAILTEVLVRLGKLEDEAEIKEMPSLPPEIAYTEPENKEELSWMELRKKAKELGVFDIKLNKEELKKAVAAVS